MRFLYINGILMDIDDSTAIGIDYQCYDVKNPARRKVAVSNSFTLPCTAKNMQVIGFAGNPYTTKTTVYDYLRCEYYIDGEQIIVNGKASVQSVGNRIELMVVDKNDIWDSLKQYLWTDLTNDIINWLHVEKKLPSALEPYMGVGLSSFLSPYMGLNGRIILPHFWSQMTMKEVDVALNTKGVLEDGTYSVIKYSKAGFNPTSQYYGGHFGIFVKTIFEFLEYKYGVNFYTNASIEHNIWDDPFAKIIFIPFRELDLRYEFSAGIPVGYYFERCNFTTGKLAPSDDLRDKPKKTVYDFVNGFFQHLNIIIKESGTNIRLSRFDDMKLSGDVVHFSDRFTGKFTFKPQLDGYGQSNWIKFKEKYDGGTEYTNARLLTSNNKTVQGKVDLFDIDAYVAGIINHTVGGNTYPVLDLSVNKSFENFIYLIPNQQASISWQFSDNSLVDNATITTYVAAMYDLNSEYSLLAEILAYPKVYEGYKWLTINDIRNIDFFKQYYIKELGGSYFINKIEGFNPDKSLQPTKIELIYVSERTPVTPPELDYWTDGVMDAFFDGENDYYI